MLHYSGIESCFSGFSLLLYDCCRRFEHFSNFNKYFLFFSRLLKKRETNKATMQVFVTCPDLGFPAVSVTVGADSVVSDVLTTAADEWDVDADKVELSFAGDALCESKRLVDYGVGANSELEIRKKLVRIFCKNWFVDDRKREKLLLWMKDHITEDLCLDTPTFSEDGCLTIDKGLLPSDAKRISFRYSNSNSTQVISQVTSIGDIGVYKSLLLTFPVLVVSPVLEVISCISVYTSLLLSFQVLVVFLVLEIISCLSVHKSLG